MTEVSLAHFQNARLPTLLREFGSVREVSPTQRENAVTPTLLREFGSVREVSPSQLLKKKKKKFFRGVISGKQRGTDQI